MVVAHSILVIVYNILKRREPYMELGSHYLVKRKEDVTLRRAVSTLETLGYKYKSRRSQTDQPN